MLYACVGLRSPGEEVEVNLGSTPFVFDIASYIEVKRGEGGGGERGEDGGEGRRDKRNKEGEYSVMG